MGIPFSRRIATSPLRKLLDWLNQHPGASPRRGKGFNRSARQLQAEPLETRVLLHLDGTAVALLDDPQMDNYVEYLYRDLLHRQPSDGEMHAWHDHLVLTDDEGAGPSRQDIAVLFTNSAEYRRNTFRDLYLTRLGRTPDAAEVDRWFALPLNDLQVEARFLASGEYYAGHGGTTESWLAGVYQDVLRRAPDEVGRAEWLRLVDQGYGLEAVATGVLASEEAHRQLVYLTYRTQLNEDPLPEDAARWAAALDQGLSLGQLRAEIAATYNYLQHAQPLEPVPAEDHDHAGHDHDHDHDHDHGTVVVESPEVIPFGEAREVLFQHHADPGHSTTSTHFFQETGDAHHFAWLDQTPTSSPTIIDLYYDFRDEVRSGSPVPNQITAAQMNVVASALSIWENATAGRLRFTRNTTASRSSIINIGTGALEPFGGTSGPGATLAIGGANFIHNGSHGISNGFAWMDVGENWETTFGNGNVSGAFDYATVVAHEVGHALGLGHTDDLAATSDNIMDPFYPGEFTAGSVNDVAHIRVLYGANAGGDIRGTKFHDASGDGRQNNGEPGLANWTIFLDQSPFNGVLDAGEASTTTDGNGNYAFTGLPAGTYRVAEVQQPGWTQTAPRDLKLQANLNIAPAPTYSDVWAEGNYAYLGHFSDGNVDIINVSNPAAPALVLRYNTGLPDVRDVEVLNNIAYFSSDTGGGVRVVNVSNPASPQVLATITAAQGGHNNTHTLSVEGNFLYLADSRTPNIKVFNISNPASPQFVRTIVSPTGGPVHEVTARNGRLYSAVISSAGGADVWDISNVAAAAPLLGSFDTGSFAHTSWPTDDGKYLAVARETSGGTVEIYDIRNPGSVTLVSSLSAAALGIDAFTPHQVFIVGNLLYVSWYQAGTQVFNITNPASPVLLGGYDTYPGGGSGYAGNWGVFPLLGPDRILSSDMQTGLYVLQLSAGSHTVTLPTGQIIQGKNFGNYQPGADLAWAANGLTAPATAQANTPFTVPRTYVVGTQSAPVNFTIAYYGSTDTTFGNADDVLLGTETISSAAGKTVGPHAGTSPNLQFPLGGQYYLFAQVDGGSAILEPNEGDNVIQAPTLITVGGPRIIDDGEAGFATAGSWAPFADPSFFRGDVRQAAPGSGESTATWTFAGLAPGLYRVSATWPAHPNRATNAQYTVLDGAAPLGAAALNQQAAPNDLADQGAPWEDLGGPYALQGTTLAVRLTNAANGFVIADAVRVEKVGELPQGPEVQVLDGAADVPDNTGSVSFGSTPVGAPVTKTFTVKNVGTAALTLAEPIAVPAGFSLAASFGSTAVAPGGSTTFQVRLDAAAAGSFGGTVSFGTGDADENPFNFAVSGAAAAPPAVRVLDDGEAGFATAGSWAPFADPSFFRGDVRQAAPGSGESTATWTFAGLAPGLYRVSATWPAHPNRATNAQYTVTTDSPMVVAVNQQLAPADFTDIGTAWKDLAGGAAGLLVNGTPLVVQLSNNAANGFVIADAVRLERVS